VSSNPLDEVAPAPGSRASKQETGLDRDAVPPPFVSSVTDDAGAERGQALAQALSNSDCHPVLLFGAASSGKTAILLSLLKYINTSSDAAATISLDLGTLPNGGIWDELRRYAERLFYAEGYEFLRQRAPEATTARYPFFVPIELKPHGAPRKKFAFFEGQGEWFHPDFDKSNPHPQFKEEITEFLRLYTGHVSSIYVAPYAVEGYDSAASQNAAEATKRIQERDFALGGIIDQYDNLRRTLVHRDQHLFILTKWDIRCGNLADPEFREYLGVLDQELQLKYPISFQRFQNLAWLPDTPNNKVKGAYCAGIFTERRTLAPVAKADTEGVDRFARELWDWIYFSANATPLYDDVRAPKPSLLDKIMAWIRN